MRYFFFGTLMDRDVLERVLGRAVDGPELTPAHVVGFDRVRTARAPYPTLVPRAGCVTDGMLLRTASRRDRRRIEHFEDEEYAGRRLTARLADGRAVRARAFFALAGVGASGEPWSLTSWARTHKPAFLEQCDAWMQDCPH